MEKSRIKIEDFIGNAGITSKVKRVESNPNMQLDYASVGGRHFLVTLKAGRFSMRVPFSQGSAHTKEPTTADVLDCLASDAASIENSRSFEEWAGYMGYDADSRKAHKTYTIVMRQAAKLRAMLGQDNYETLLWNTERM